MTENSQAQINATLKKGVRAARRGYKDPARRLLAEVLQADPNNEEAWLWLARVTDAPEKRAECLQRVLAINPDNQWAAEQLAAPPTTPPPAPATPAEKPAPAPKAEFELEQLKCPKCGGTVELRAGAGAKTLVCGFCHSVIDLGGEGAAVTGKTRRTKPTVPIKLGTQGTFEGERHQVIGWLRYEGWDDEDRWRWDEWLLASSKGGYLWLSYDDEEGFVLQKKITPTKAFNPRSDRSISVPGGTARVTERAKAKIIALDGELTWRAKVGEQINYLDARRGDMRYSVEYTKDEIELTGGPALTEVEVWKAFGRDDMVAAAQRRMEARRRYRMLAAVCGIFLVVAFLGALVAYFSGQQLFSDETSLVMGREERRIGPFEVTQPNRVHKISLKSSRLPVNSWAVVEVSASDEQENEFYLFATEFWDEEGWDSDGAWHESDLKGEHLFRPDTAGPYYLTLALDEATVESLTVAVTVEGGIWVSRYFIIFAGVCAVLAFIFLCLGENRLVGRSVLEAMLESD